MRTYLESAINPEVVQPICLSTSTILSTFAGSNNGEVIRFSTAITTPAEIKSICLLIIAYFRFLMVVTFGGTNSDSS